MTPILRLRRLHALALVAALATACGGSGADGPDPSDKLTIAVPATLAGLSVHPEPDAPEKIKKNIGKRPTYMRDISVFALREGKELRGVLEVVRLTPDARPDDVDFRRRIADQIGGSARKPLRVGDTLVYKASDNQKTIYIWFVGRFMAVLIVREQTGTSAPAVDLERLLAEAIALKPVPARA